MKNYLIILFLLVATITISANNSNLVLDSTVVYIYNAENDSFLSVKKEYFKNDFRDEKEISFEWDRTNGLWKETVKLEMSFNERLDLIFIQNSNWDSMSKTWIGESKSIYEFDNNGNKILTHRFNWNSKENSWQQYTKKESKYENNKLIYEESNFFTKNAENEDIDGRSKKEFVYDSLGNEISNTYSKWDFDKSNWIFYRRIENVYNSIGKQAIYIRKLWDLDLEDWFLNNKTEYEYDEEGNKTFSSYYSWNVDSVKLICSKRIKMFMILLVIEFFTIENNGINS